jgi:hypothetical protein
MIIKNCVQYYAQPWAHSWLKMRWDLALFSSRWQANSDLWVHVVWSEELLNLYLTPDKFKAETEDFLLQLQTQNRFRVDWEVRRTGESTGHAVQLQWERRKDSRQA